MFDTAKDIGYTVGAVALFFVAMYALNLMPRIINYIDKAISTVL